MAGILLEAARWLEEQGHPLWQEEELQPDRIAAEVVEGLYFLGGVATSCVATVRFQLEDPLFWPDARPQEAAYIHRLAIRRSAAGGPIASSMLQWAAQRTRSLGRRYLRLDCDANRPKLRAVYEQFGFRHHSNRQVGSYFVARYEYSV